MARRKSQSPGGRGRSVSSMAIDLFLRRRTPLREPEILVTLNGGLGNQLFQFAAGFSLALRLDCGLALDLSALGTAGGRPFELDFLVSDRVRVSAVEDRSAFATVSESGFAFDPQVAGCLPGVRLHGWFQSWRYFDDHSQTIREYVSHRLPSGPIGDAPATICIHVRRGDYMKEPHASFHGVVGLRYFDRAVGLLRRVVGGVPGFVFSDEEPTAIEVASSIPDCTPVSAYGKAVEVLDAMRQHQAFAISNSSLSWWAALLAPCPEPLVIAPRPWFQDGNHDTRDLLPPSWLTIDHRF